MVQPDLCCKEPFTIFLPCKYHCRFLLFLDDPYTNYCLHFDFERCGGFGVCIYTEVEMFLITSGFYIHLDEGEIIPLEDIPMSVVNYHCYFQRW